MWNFQFVCFVYLLATLVQCFDFKSFSFLSPFDFRYPCLFLLVPRPLGNWAQVLFSFIAYQNYLKVGCSACYNETSEDWGTWLRGCFLLIWTAVANLYVEQQFEKYLWSWKMWCVEFVDRNDCSEMPCRHHNCDTPSTKSAVFFLPIFWKFAPHFRCPHGHLLPVNN